MQVHRSLEKPEFIDSVNFQKYTIMRLLAILILFPYFAFSQTVEITADDSGRYIYQEVINVSTVSKADIFTGVQRWAALSSPTSPIFIQLEDYDRGKFICNVEMVRGLGSVFTHQTIEIDIKDGKYRVTASNFIYSVEAADATGFTHTPFEQMLFFRKQIVKRSEEQIQFLMDNLYKEITTNTEEDNW